MPFTEIRSKNSLHYNMMYHVFKYNEENLYTYILQ